MFILLLFLTEKILFRYKFVPKKSKLFVEAESWNLDWYEYLEFDGEFPFFNF